MSRDITSAVETALGEPNVNLCLLVEMQFAGGTVRVCNLDFSLAWNSQTWLALGRLGAIDAIDEGEGLAGRSVAFMLSAVPEEQIAIALGESVQGRRVKAWLGVFSTANALLVDPVLIYRGRMDNCELVEGTEATVKLNTVGRLADFERARVRRMNHEDHITQWPGDRYFEFVPQMVEKPLNWGVPG